ncbi:MAG: SDR family oxidoreductase [Pyrinomonadaceae bacterium]|nr:SDR family oxidoreductase [Pyrinomonadaceae bacterium]
MRVLILGGNGMLGHKLVQNWRERFDVWTTLRGSFNDVKRFGFFDENQTLSRVEAQKFDSIIEAFEIVRPNVIVNCIGIIKQLPSSKNIVSTLEVNAIFPQRLAKLAQTQNARLITLSTDCVFSGERGNYGETDVPDATDLYGQSKHWGEISGENCLTLRTSIIGRELETSHSLVEWILSNSGGKVKGFTEAIYSGFPTIILAEILANVIENHPELNGVWHVASEPISKFELLKLIRDVFDVSIEIEPYGDFQIDRSLNADKFRAATNFVSQTWREMVYKMAIDKDIYDKWREI